MNIKEHEAAIRILLDTLRPGIAYDRYEATFSGEDVVQGEHITLVVPCCSSPGCKEGEVEHQALPYKDVSKIAAIFEAHFGHVFRAIKHNGIRSGNAGTYFLITLQLEDEKKGS